MTKETRNTIRIIGLAPLEVILQTAIGAFDGFLDGLAEVRIAWNERNRVW